LISGGHKSEYDHLKDSIINFPSPEGFKQMMIDSGFSDCISKNIFFDVVHLYVGYKKVTVEN
jgi:ubiquinone/menaquinone biosynthesis C-methylase UbiE